MKKTRRLSHVLPSQLARLRTKLQRQPLLRWLGNRGLVTVILGAALSVGGVTEVLQETHFRVQRDLDAVRVVSSDGTVVADVRDGFTANSIFKLSQLFPESVVTRESSLFRNEWIPVPQEPPASARKGDLFHVEMSRINDAIRHDFFANAVPFGDIIHEKARKYDVDPALVAAVIETESRFRSRARSQVGARGLMQLMPRTGRWLGADNLYDPDQNIDAGVKYIKYLQARFGGNLKMAIAAYNAGEGNVRRYDGVPPFRETQSYVKKVLRSYKKRNDQLKAYDQTHGGTVGAVADERVVTLR